MKKLFLAIYFSMLIITPQLTMAKAIELNNPMELEQRKEQIPEVASQQIIDEDMPDVTDQEAMDNYMRERFSTVVTTQLDENTNSMNIQHSAEYIANLNESKKSTFQKIYDEAINRISNSPQSNRDDIANEENRYYQMQAMQQKEVWEEPDFPVVNIELPTGEKIVAPAKEHIPYLFSRIEILPTGMINISETIMVVANGEKLKNGLARVIPRFSTSRENVSNKIDINLVSVDINGQEIPHKLEEKDKKIYITPKQEYNLNPGIYTYTFNYVIDRQLWDYDNFKEFYWDATGSSWNLVIARAGASISLPGATPSISQTILLGYNNQLTTNNAIIVKDNNILGFATQIPLFVGEGMHILISMPLADFISPDLSKKFTWFTDDYGDIIFSIMGLLAILISYYISWRGLEKNKQKYNLRKTAPMMRFLAKGIFDKISFGAFLLDLYRKNIIDIQKSDNDILLVKKTDAISFLNKNEKKALHNLFINKESILSVNANNALKIKRAYKLIEKDTSSKLKQFAFRLNFGYLFFSIGMLFLAIMAIASLSINMAQTAVILVSCCITITFYVWILNKKFKSKILNIISKIFAVFIILFTLFMMTIYVNPISVVLILGMIYAIFAYTTIFAKRNGLIRNNVKEAIEYKSYLLHNIESISLGRDFLSQQAYIYAFEVIESFPQTNNIKDYYRLDVMAEMVRKL